jgi:hypothetical protein
MYALSLFRLNNFLYYIFTYDYEQDSEKATDRVAVDGRGAVWYYLDLQWAQAISVQYNYVD